MASKKNNPNQLIVEATDDLFMVSGLMGHHIPWPSDNHPVNIKKANSADEALNPAYLALELKGSELKVLGVIVDADERFASRWSRIKTFCEKHRFQNIPDEMPANGLILVNEDGIRFGAWIMPDNISSGMLETFCKLLIKEDAQDCWKYAQHVVKKARQKGASWKDAHQDKTCIHTWLAWQDPPGERIGRAITQKTLDPTSPNATKFIAWFKRLYQLS